ncbi:hypothetical protein [Thermococcus sp.]
MEWLDFETMDIHDERAKELAQILTNEKALAYSISSRTGSFQ